MVKPYDSFHVWPDYTSLLCVEDNLKQRSRIPAEDFYNKQGKQPCCGGGGGGGVNCLRVFILLQRPLQYHPVIRHSLLFMLEYFMTSTFGHLLYHSVFKYILLLYLLPLKSPYSRNLHQHCSNCRSDFSFYFNILFFMIYNSVFCSKNQI